MVLDPRGWAPAQDDALAPAARATLGALTDPPTFALARLAHFWIQIAPESRPSQAGGILGAGASHAMPYRAFTWLPPGVYLAAAIDRTNGAPLGAWRFEKRAPARSWPLDAAAVAWHEPRPPRRGAEAVR